MSVVRGASLFEFETSVVKRLGRGFIGMRLRDFAVEEDGAITVDFVVITASIVLLGLAIIPFLSKSTDEGAGKIETYLSDMEVSGEGKR